MIVRHILKHTHVHTYTQHTGRPPVRCRVFGARPHPAPPQPAHRATAETAAEEEGDGGEGQQRGVRVCMYVCVCVMGINFFLSQCVRRHSLDTHTLTPPHTYL